MIVAMLQVIVKLPEGIVSLKEKRRIVNSLKQRIRNKFYVSTAEVDLNESLGFAQIGVALVTNSRVRGESVMQKIILFLENENSVDLYEAETRLEEFGN
ncbi:MAG: DUF503 domain-containing protein [Bacteroidetes bacterium]|nr:DUF503 domain-containing protein [Bacteroidota bacterium]